MKQIGQKKITGQIVVKTGLHIGASNDKVEIGGMDNPIIRNPLTREPYIPGSSIKGKMRSLLEWKFDLVQKSGGKPCFCGEPDCPICRVFGSANSSKNSDNAKNRGPSRLIVRDAKLAPEWSDKFLKEGKPIIEEKSENSLNRITAEANPRPIERVVPGVAFDFEIVYRIIDTDDGGSTDEKNFEKVVKEGLRLLQNDYLGGGGSRGNGRIEFVGLKVQDINEKNETTEQAITL
jgi:CRISPR-associated protein Csm3